MSDVRIDLHTHSVASPDGALSAANYAAMLTDGLDMIAVTDHNTIDFARTLQADLGPAIIIGEEITTSDGELIGLYLRQAVPPGLSAAKTAACIHEQGGLVYLPHPFETVRQGLSTITATRIAGQVDIVEIANGRAFFQNRSRLAMSWAQTHDVAGAASSDSHGRHGWGRSYSLLPATPTAATLADLLRHADYQVRLPGARGLLYPKFNRLRKRTRRSRHA